MKMKIIHVSIMLVVATLLMSTVEDLPDVEISGPSKLKSILEKRGLHSTDLLIPDVIDSLKTILPALSVQDRIINTERLHYLYLKNDNLWDYHGYFIADSLFSSSTTFQLEAGRYSLIDKWAQLYAETGILHKSFNSGISVMFKTTNSKSELNTSFQSMYALSLNYNIYKFNLFTHPASMSLAGEIQNNRFDYISEENGHNTIHFNNSVGFTVSLSPKVCFDLKGCYSYKSPAISFELFFPNDGDTKIMDFIKSLSVFVADDKACPGLFLSQTFLPSEKSIIQIFQKSEMEVHDYYNLLIRQPWQKYREDSFYTFTPLNAHISFSNRAVSSPNNNIDLTIDLGVKYKMDGLTYQVSNPTDILPTAESENILQNIATFKATLKSRDTYFSQTAVLEKDLTNTQKNEEAPYIPLLTMKTELTHVVNSFGFSGWVKQYYHTKSDLGKYLRDSIDLGTKLDYSITSELSMFLELSNLLNKSKYVFRTLPTEPTALSLGVSYRF